jgi:putative membrane protein
MQAIRMWNLAVAAALCCSPTFAQAPGSTPGGSGQTPTTQPGASASPSMQQQQQQQDANGMNGPAAAATGGASMDKAFVKKALEGSMAEVQMGQLALQKSSDDQVKQFAQRMVDDHGKMVDQMKPVAEQMGVKVPDAPSKGHMKNMEKMKALSGEDFDKAYIKDMVKDHKKDSSEFKQEAQSTQNPQLKELVTQGSQTIDSHLQQIQQIAQSKGTEKAKM